MAKIEVMGKNIHYEVYGEGEPLVILNGIMMSTVSWYPFKDILSKDYKLILLDMVDQGQSDKMDREYTQDLHVDMLRELFEKLNLDSIHLFGISYGGEVAIKFALKYQSMLKSLILSNVPYKTNGLLRYIASRWIETFKTYDGRAFYKEVNQFVYSEKFYDKHMDYLKEKEEFFNKILTKEWFDGMIRLLNSGDNYDVTEDLHKIEVPTLILGGEDDRITPPSYQREINKRIKDSRLLIVEGSGHLLPYERPKAFLGGVLGFLKIYNENLNLF